MTEPTLVSACLLGIECRYDGQSKTAVIPVSGPILPVCPEVMAGFGVPRPAIERTLNGRVQVVETRQDVTEPLTQACAIIVERAKRAGVRRAVLKERSPSCGSSQVWFDGAIVPGAGLLTEQLQSNGIVVSNEAGITS